MRVTVDRIAPEGQAIAHSKGSNKVIFLPYGNPGDEAEVRILEERKGYATAEIISLIKPGPGRIDPPCPHHFKIRDEGRGMRDESKNISPSHNSYLISHIPQTISGGLWCGGCDWQHLQYPRQLELKKNLVQDALERIGKIKNPPLLDPIPSPEPWRYRNKVQVPFGMGRGKSLTPSAELRVPTGAPEEPSVLVGFYHPGTHRIVNFEDCLVQPELSVQIVQKVKQIAQKYRWQPYNEDAQSGWLRHLFIRTNEKKEALVAFVTRSPNFPHSKEAIQDLTQTFPSIISFFQNIQPLKTSVILGPRWIKLWGRDHMEERIGNLHLSVSPEAFLQVNTKATEKLYQQVEEFLKYGKSIPRNVLDLYCGVGTISLWVSPLVQQVVGIEENREAVQDAYQNARLNRVRNVHFLAGKVEYTLPKLDFPSDAVILDPPRQGCQPEVLKKIIKLEARKVVYVSCNPATFARDVLVLGQGGFRLIQVQPVDLFPQ
ncbi:MAG: 23S rRNA (uracil(1939)-C(5))-methyltransferase RlmD, partial [Elusimicrobia bacterium]|nr:23S rRNA (uracil(1939)-C(5))-methyltransferase RlmD [Elusimicrobiota bacterium]